MVYDMTENKLYQALPEALIGARSAFQTEPQYGVCICRIGQMANRQEID